MKPQRRLRGIYPKVEELGVLTGPILRRDRYRAGFEHGLGGGQLNKVEYFRLSFRMGFRAAKLYLRELRRRQGILSFPFQGRIRLRATG